MGFWDKVKSFNAAVDVTGGAAARLGAAQQLQAQREARNENSAIIAREREEMSALQARQSNTLGSGYDLAMRGLERQYGAQQGYLKQARADLAQQEGLAQGHFGQAAVDLASQYRDQQSYLGSSGAALTRGRSQSLGALSKAYDQSRADLQPVLGLQKYGEGATRAVGTQGINAYDVTGQRSRLEERIGQGDALLAQAAMGTNLEMDPGYQFRIQQGEQALARSRAAAGGRTSGAALKELSAYSQGLASQEYAAANERRLAQNAQLQGIIAQQYGAAGNVDAMRQQELLNQAGRSDAAAQQAEQNRLTASLAAQQNQMALAQMGYGAQGQLSRDASQYGQNVAGLETAYGQNMASVYGQQGAAAQQYGSSLAALGAQRAAAAQQHGTALAGVGGQQATAAQQYGLGQSALQTDLASAQSNVYGATADRSAALSAAQMGVNANYAQYPGMLWQNQANIHQGNMNAFASIFGGIMGGRSDARAKTDIRDGSDDALELLRAMRPYSFSYKDDRSRLRLLGVMAQDIERTAMGKAMIIDTEDGKVVNAWPAVSALLGIVSHLHREIEKLKSAKGA